MANVPRFAKAFVGRWRIVEMDNWDSDFLHLVEEAHLTFEGKSDGEIAFGALKGFLDVRYGARETVRPARSSHGEGHDENDLRGAGRWAPRPGARARPTGRPANLAAECGQGGAAASLGCASAPTAARSRTPTTTMGALSSARSVLRRARCGEVAHLRHPSVWPSGSMAVKKD